MGKIIILVSHSKIINDMDRCTRYPMIRAIIVDKISVLTRNLDSSAKGSLLVYRPS